MEPSGVSLPPPPCQEVDECVPVEGSDPGRMQVGGHRRGSGQRETAQPASSNLLIAVLHKYFRSVTLSRLLQAKIRAPAGSLGCGYKCSLLLPAQANDGGPVVSVLGNKLGISFNGVCQPSRFPLLGIASVLLRSDPVPALCQPGFPLSSP